MSSFKSEENELLRTLLGPLLDDFQYWFERSRSLLESRQIAALEVAEQAQLLEQVKNAQQEVAAARSLFQATGGQVGIEMATLAQWHQLVAQGWRASSLARQEGSNPED